MQQEYARQYRNLYERHWWWQARERFVLGHVERAHSPEWTNILDIGCGDALLFPKLSRFGDVRGIEADATLVSPSSPYRDRIAVTPFGPEYRTEQRYDLILMLDVLEHLPDDVGSLKAAARMLKPNGRLLITVPALESLWSRHDEVNLHYRRYTRPSLRRAVRASGLEVERLEYYFFWTVVPMLLRSWLFPGRRASGDESGAVTVPSPIISRLCFELCRAEQCFSRFFGGLIGSSLFTMLKRPRKSELLN